MEVKSFTSIKTDFQELKDLGNSLRSSGLTICCISGGFDPFHVGHLHMVSDAAKLADVLIVLVNGDEFLRRKKGYVFMPQEERREILQSIKGVYHAIIYEDDTQFVANGLVALKPDIFYNGGDRQSVVSEEEKVCKELGIQLKYGGLKVQSSSDLCHQFYKQYLKKRFRECWGYL